MQTENLSAADRIVFGTISGLLALIGLAGTALPPASVYVTEMVIFSLLLLWLADRLIFSHNPEFEWVALPPVLLLLICLLFSGGYMVPLPGGVIRLISPQSFLDQSQAAHLLASAHDLPVPDLGWMTITPHLDPARWEWLKSVACLGLFFLMIQTLKSTRQIKILAMVLLVAGLPAAVGTFLRGNGAGMGDRTVGYMAHGRYVADHMALLLLLAFGYLIAGRKKGQRLMSGLQSKRGDVQKIIGLLSPETARPQRIFFFFGAVAMGAAFLRTASRSGMLALAVTLILAGGGFLSKPGFRRYGGLALVMGMGALVGGGGAGMATDTRQQQIPGCGPLISMVTDYAATGVGPGNFESFYPRYGQHCDAENGPCPVGRPFLKAVAEYGLLCSVLAFWAFGAWLYRLVRIWWRRKSDALAIGLGASAVGCCLLIGGMGVLGGSGMWRGPGCFFLAAIPALGYCALFRRGYGFSEKFFWKTRSMALNRRRCTVLLVPALVAWLGMINLIVISFGSGFFPPGEAAWISGIDFNAGPPKNENRLNEKQPVMPVSVGQSMSHLEKNLRYNPGSGESWYRLGKCYALQTGDAYQYLNKWLPLAELCFDQGIRRRPCDAGMLFDAAGYWVWRAGILADEGLQAKSIEKFQKLFSRSLAIDPENWQAAAARVWQYFPEDTVVMGIVPEDSPLKSRILEWTVLQETS